MNNTNQTIPYYPLIELWISVALLTASMGVIGNLWFAIIIFTTKNLWKKSHYRLVFGVSITDFLCTCFFIPYEGIQTFSWLHYHRLVGSSAFCIFEAGVFSCLFSSSNYGQLMVASNRFLAVFLPLIYRKYSTVKAVTIVYLSVAQFLPILYHYGGYSWLIIYKLDMQLGDCSEVATNPITLELRSILFIYSPVIGSLSCYIAIFTKIITMSSDKRAEVIKRSRGSLSMCASVVLYAICIMPVWIAFTTNDYGNILVRTLWVKIGFRGSYCLNPVIYFVNPVILQIKMSIATCL